MSSVSVVFIGNCRDNVEVDTLLREVQRLLSQGHTIREVVVHGPSDQVEKFRLRAKAFLPELVDSQLRCVFEMPNVQEDYGIEFPPNPGYGIVVANSGTHQ